MFTKLLKHEWRATKGIIALLCVIILIAGIAIGGVMHYMIWAEQSGALVVLNEDGSASNGMSSGFASVLCVLLIMAGVAAIAICTAGSLFFLIFRFYKRCFTDEGYLTFTLPVTSHQVLLSSFLNTIIGGVIMIAAVLVAVGIAAVLFLTAFPENLIWADVSVGLKEAMGQLWTSLLDNWDTFAALTGTSLLAVLSGIIVLMLAVTIGALIAKKHKILAAVAVYYGISLVQSFAQTIPSLLTASTENINSMLSVNGVTSLVTGIAGYFLMHWLLEKKLNLA